MIFRLTLCYAMLMALLPTTQAQEKVRVYLGTYTGSGSQGIYQCELNVKDGSLTEPTLSVETSSPSFVAFHPNKQYLYAVNETEAKISAFAIDKQSGKLTFLNSQPSKGDAPCHLVVDAAGKNVLAANYTGGSCISIPLLADGKLSDKSSFQQHQGPKKNGHSIHLDKANKYALCCDLGLDKVIIYAFDATTGTLSPHSSMDTPKGAGPRHFAWSIDGKHAYVNGESDMTVLACDYDAAKGTLTQKQVLSTLPSDVKRNGGSTAETVVHPSGKFVYVSNRDPYNSLAIFSVDPQSGLLTAVGHYSDNIKTPRNFAIEPSGKYLLVANQGGGNVSVLSIDASTGKLSATGKSVKIDKPVCVRFMAL